MRPRPHPRRSICTVCMYHVRHVPTRLTPNKTKKKRGVTGYTHDSREQYSPCSLRPLILPLRVSRLLFLPSIFFFFLFFLFLLFFFYLFLLPTRYRRGLMAFASDIPRTPSGCSSPISPLSMLCRMHRLHLFARAYRRSV